MNNYDKGQGASVETVANRWNKKMWNRLSQIGNIDNNKCVVAYLKSTQLELSGNFQQRAVSAAKA